MCYNVGIRLSISQKERNMELNSSSIEQVKSYISNATRLQRVNTTGMATLTNMQRNVEKLPVKILEDSLQLTQEAVDKCRSEMQKL